ncbi:MAG: cytochrome c [Acidobacteriota bacterium]
MNRLLPRRTKAIALVAAMVTAPAIAGQADEIELGRRLYERGLGIDGRPVTAVLEPPTLPSGQAAGQGVELSAATLPCASCHGPEGRGRPEGGVRPSDLRWSALTRPWTAGTAHGRSHPPYDDPKLIRAVTMGRDPAGHRLQVAMPRYRLSHGDARALLAYLKTLGEAPAPGVNHDSVTLGVLVSSPPDDAQRAAMAVLQAWQADLATGGGVYGRNLRLAVFAADAATASEPPEVLAWIVLGAASAAELSPQTPALLLGNTASPCADCLRVAASLAPSRRWRELQRRHHLPTDHLPNQLQALAVAEILTTALESTGREVDLVELRRRLAELVPRSEGQQTN